MKKFTTFYKMSLCALATIIFYGCGTYNASSTSYVNGIYGRSQRMTQKASQASAVNAAEGQRSAVVGLPDSLARFLLDSTYVPAPDSYEMKLRQFDKERYEKPVNVTVVNNYLNYNPWWYSYSYRWYDPFWDPWWDPYWDPWWPRPYISIHVGPYWYGPYWHDTWWPVSWYHPYYPYNPWRPAIIVPVHVREARYTSRTSSSWGGGGVSGGSRYGRTAAGSTYIRGNSGTASRTNSSYSRNSYSNTKSYSANIRNDQNREKERLYDYTRGNQSSTSSYRRSSRVGSSGSGNSSGSGYTKGNSKSSSSNYNSNNSSNSNSGNYQRSNNSGNYQRSSNTYNNSGNSSGYQYRRTGGSGGGGYSPSSSSGGGGGHSAPTRSSGGGGGRRR